MENSETQFDKPTTPLAKTLENWWNEPSEMNYNYFLIELYQTILTQSKIFVCSRSDLLKRLKNDEFLIETFANTAFERILSELCGNNDEGESDGKRVKTDWYEGKPKKAADRKNSTSGSEYLTKENLAASRLEYNANQKAKFLQNKAGFYFREHARIFENKQKKAISRHVTQAINNIIEEASVAEDILKRIQSIQREDSLEDGLRFLNYENIEIKKELKAEFFDKIKTSGKTRSVKWLLIKIFSGLEKNILVSKSELNQFFFKLLGKPDMRSFSDQITDEHGEESSIFDQMPLGPGFLKEFEDAEFPEIQAECFDVAKIILKEIFRLKTKTNGLKSYLLQLSAANEDFMHSLNMPPEIFDLLQKVEAGTRKSRSQNEKSDDGQNNEPVRATIIAKILNQNKNTVFYQIKSFDEYLRNSYHALCPDYFQFEEHFPMFFRAFISLAISRLKEKAKKNFSGEFIRCLLE